MLRNALILTGTGLAAAGFGCAVAGGTAWSVAFIAGAGLTLAAAARVVLCRAREIRARR